MVFALLIDFYDDNTGATLAAGRAVSLVCPATAPSAASIHKTRTTWGC
jgi:hypothetical protein